MADAQRINGTAYGWSSIAAQFDGDPYFGIKSISFADKVEVGLGYGLGRHYSPVSRTAGKYSADDSKMVMRLDSWQALSVALAQKGLGTNFAAPFHVSVQWVEFNGAPISRELEDCRIIGVSSAPDQNSDESSVELTLSVMRIRYDGLTMFEEFPSF